MTSLILPWRHYYHAVTNTPMTSRITTTSIIFPWRHYYHAVTNTPMTSRITTTSIIFPWRHYYHAVTNTPMTSRITDFSPWTLKSWKKYTIKPITRSSNVLQPEYVAENNRGTTVSNIRVCNKTYPGCLNIRSMTVKISGVCSGK